MACGFLGTTLTVALGGLVVAGDYFCSWEQYGSFVAAIASLLNAVLLFVTLNHQDRSFKQERFETTFFNFLEQRRKIANDFRLSYWCWNYEEHEPYVAILEGTNCITVAYNEVKFIKRNLFASKYLGMLELDDNITRISVELALQKIHDELNDDIIAIRKIDNEFYARLINRVYHITPQIFQQVQKYKGNDECELKIAFNLFVRVNGWFLEHYLRHLKQILVFVNRNATDKQYYVNFLRSQMTRQEMRVVYYYALTNKCCRILLDKLGMMEYVRKLHRL